MVLIIDWKVAVGISLVNTLYYTIPEALGQNKAACLPHYILFIIPKVIVKFIKREYLSYVDKHP